MPFFLPIIESFVFKIISILRRKAQNIGLCELLRAYSEDKTDRTEELRRCNVEHKYGRQGVEL